MSTKSSENLWPDPEPKNHDKYMYLAPDQSLTDYDEIYGYALTIDGYQYAQDKWGIKNCGDTFWDKVRSFKASGKWYGSFEDLRFCLFAYQRRIRWGESGAFDAEGRNEFIEIYKALCEIWKEKERIKDTYRLGMNSLTKPSTCSFKHYIKESLETTPVLERLEQMIQQRSSKAGIRLEEVFTREFLCPIIARYFYEHVRSELSLTDDEIKRGLGTEGFKNCPGFGFSPARQKNHLFTKSDFIKSSPPATWFAACEKKLPNYQACPDFSISNPLPFSLVGEVKYFRSGSPEKAIKDLFNAARQVMFYLGAFHGNYDSALIVVADASPGYSFHKAIQLLKHELIQRFSDETGIYLLTIRIR